MSDYYRNADAVLQEKLAASPLFGAALARRTDPPPSHEAGRRAKSFRGEHHLRILAAIEDGPAGQTELARRTGMTVAAVSKRLHELRKAGAIERTGREVEGGESEYRRATDGR